MSKKDKKVENGLVDTPVQTVETTNPKQELTVETAVPQENTPGNTTRAFRG